MLVRDILQDQQISFSFEFFPPKTEAASLQLFEAINDLMPLQPSFVSVTFGAGGSTRTLTRELILRLIKESNLTVVAHLTCVGSSRDDIYAIVSEYHDSGIKNFMALRGDPPRGQKGFTAHADGFQNATELIHFIKKEFPDTGIGAAAYPDGHPETPNRLREMEYLKAKVDAGVDYLCTQLFFDNRTFYDFRERCAITGIQVPILAGIMPITSHKSKERMAELAAGVRYPAPLLKALNRAVDDEGVEKAGIHWATEQVRDLLDHRVAGVHFYTLNRSLATREIYTSLGVVNSSQL